MDDQQNSPKLDILFRSCDRVNCFSGGKRLVEASKQEIILRSLNSLIDSIWSARCKSIYKFPEYTITVVDDGSSSETIDRMLSLMDTRGVSGEIVSVDGQGNGDSLKTTYEWAKRNAEDLIFFIEDDYLHKPEMMWEMNQFFYICKHRPGMDHLVLHPCDYPDRYTRALYKSWILLGHSRHWRSIQHTTCTFMLHKSTLLEHWDKYMAFTEYGKKPGVTEDNTINLVYRTVPCFSPMPTLSVHLQYKSVMSPYIDWKSMWINSNEKVGPSL